MAAITLDNLTVGYRSRQVLTDVNLEIRKGEIVTLIGPNGAGKSTLLYSIGAQLKTLAGTVYIEDVDLHRLDRKNIAKKISLLLTTRIRPQLMTCFDVVATGRYPYTGGLGRLQETDVIRVREAMALLQVETLAERDYNTLSDGQKQRVLIARAVCQDPEILILDEPTSYLDIRYRIQLMDVLQELCKRGITILMSLHELDLALSVSDRVICVKEGQEVVCDTPDHVIAQGRLKDLFDLDDALYARVLENLHTQQKDAEARDAGHLDQAKQPVDSSAHVQPAAEVIHAIWMTQNGYAQTLRLQELFKKEGKILHLAGKDTYKEVIKEAFEKRQDLLFFTAAGIALRSIAPYIADKMRDPAVLVIDEQAQHVIPVLSGHVGGANALALQVASLLGAEPVLTTASDVNGLPAIDRIAAIHHLILCDRKKAKEFAAALLTYRQAQICIPKAFREDILPEDLPPEFDTVDLFEGAADKAQVCIAPVPSSADGPLFLVPRQLVVGMGCRRGKSVEDLYAFLAETMEEAGLSMDAICVLASVDRKADEAGLIETAARLDAAFQTFDAQTLEAQEGDFAESGMVRDVIGVGNVCERAAIAAGAHRLLVRKQARDGMTIAIGIKPVTISFQEGEDTCFTS